MFDNQPPKYFDIGIYGGTAGGVITAVTAAHEGLSVALLEPGNHLGGMVTGGLSATDHGEKQVIGGYSLEFYERLGRHYGRAIEWYPEPHVAEKVLLEMILEAKTVTVYYRHRLKENRAVHKEGTRIVEIRMENGSLFQAAVFVDASYEGDLMAQAGVSYTWGREGTGQYGESLAGVRPKDLNHQFDFPVSAYDETGRILPEIQMEARRVVGDFVMTQKDVQSELTKPDVIGMGSYNSDSHNVQRYITEEGHVQNEGNMEVPVTPYQIPYRLILPKQSQVTNLLVTVCFSASHVTYSTLRMEPVYMVIGQAAGVAAKMSIDGKVPVQDIDPTALTIRLREQRAVLEWTPQET